MIALPDEHVLVGLFACEPTLADPGVSWTYNRLTFSTRRGRDHLVCVIEPAYGEFEASWTQDGLLRFSTRLNHVGKLEVHMGRGDEHLVATGLEPQSAVLKLRLRPEVALEFACLKHP